MSIQIVIQQKPVTHQQIFSHKNSASHGGQCYFFGAVRSPNHGKIVKGIEYECYQPLAETQLTTLCQRAMDTWGETLSILIVHATGYLKVGELSVGIRVSTPHRKEAFAACQFLIDTLKEEVPIWKREYYEDGHTDWVKGHALCQESPPVSNA